MSLQTMLERDGTWYRLDYTRGRSLSIPMDFEGAQPNFFGVSPARKEPLVSGGFVGHPARGGACRVECVQVIPHCQGTHTETVSHIVTEEVPIAGTWVGGPVLARLISVCPETMGQVHETYRPIVSAEDQVITARALENACRQDSTRPVACIVRTLPNSPDKRGQRYDAAHPAPFFTREATQFLVSRGIQHLLVDLPSIDRLHDEGQLMNHHIFWNVAQGSKTLAGATRRECTITELIYVPDDVPDGWYALLVQVPDWLIDAAPSRPVIYPLIPAEEPAGSSGCGP